MSCLRCFAFVVFLSGFVQNGLSKYDYGEALTKSLLYFEAQRSGKLPSDQRVQWRGDSALNDGKTAGVIITLINSVLPQFKMLVTINVHALKK